MFLKEETRNDLYPVIENEYESVVFRGGVINTIKEIDKIKDCKILFLSALFIDEEKYIEVVKTFKNVLLNNITKEEGNKIISSLDIKEDNSLIGELDKQPSVNLTTPTGAASYKGKLEKFLLSDIKLTSRSQYSTYLKNLT